ncbi:MAG: adenylate/guanylate cyclase domain-containing protein [Actinomycetota bacterium]|nr:adenylate/guanylate cyclase domain-containing protein [Actinomycetota bacterium]
MALGERAVIEPDARVGRRTRVVAAVAVVLSPLALLALLRLRPALDARWQNHPAHFWLVLVAAAIAMSLGYAITVPARRRRDARLFLVSLAFLSGAGFLGLHALATPGVLVGPNAGFELATPVGLLLGGLFVAASALDLSPSTSRRITARSRPILGGLLGVMVAWAVMSLAEVRPLNDPLQQEALEGWQVALGVVGVLGYGLGAVGYLRLYQRRRARFVFAVALAFALLAESMVVIAYAVNWRVSWWEWHVLMLAAFAVIAAAAKQEWHEERFSALYLEQTLAGAEEVSVLFADLQGYTAFSERTPPGEVARMLNTYFSRLVPLMEEHGGQVHQLIGDAIMVVFNKAGEQPDHALLAVRAGLALQRVATEIADREPDWPRFRVGVNSGDVASGVLGAERGYRKHDVIGDTVNLAARLESQAPVGEVVIGEGTYDRLPASASVERLPALRIKGKTDAVTAYVVRGGV